MAGYITPLSDNSYVEVPDGTDPKDVPNIVAQAEAQLSTHYSQQARDNNAPVVGPSINDQPGNKIYSPIATYPNTALGHAGAWADMNIPGAEWAKTNIAPPIKSALSSITGTGNNSPEDTALRIGVNRMLGPVDLIGSGLNVMKHQLAPERGTEGDIPSLTGAILDQAGVKQLSPDDNLPRQLTEAGVTGLLSPGSWPGIVQSLKNAGWGVSGTAASDLAGRYLGEPGAYLANLVFGGAVPFKQIGGKTVGAATAGPNAPDTYAAWLAARPITPGGNFQGLNSPPPPGMPNFFNSAPSFKTLGNESAQRIAASLSGVPYVGAPLAKGEANDAAFVQWGRNAAAEDLSGPQGLPPEGVNAGTRGANLISGAQQAILRIVADQEARQQQQRALMSAPGGPPGSAEVPAGGFYQGGADAIAGRSDTIRNAGQTRLDEIAGSSPGGPNYGVGPGGHPRPDVPLPSQPSLTWDHISDMVTEFNDTLAKSGRPALAPDVAAAFKAAANQSRQDALDAQSPGAGAQFRENNVVYARAQAALEQLRQMAGEELGSSGRFKDVPTQQQADAYLKARMQSPDSLDQTLLHPAYPQDNRLNAAAQIIATLGDPTTGGTSGGFRPEAFANQYGSGARGQRPTIDALLTGGQGGGQPAAATSLLDNLRTVAENYGPATSRFGLIKSLGSAEVVRKVLEGVSKGVEHIMGPNKVPVVAQIGHSMSALLNSDAVRRGQGGQPQNWTPYTNSAAVAASTIAAEQRNRLHFGAVGSQPGATP